MPERGCKINCGDFRNFGLSLDSVNKTGKSEMKVAFASSEVFPFAKTGGLGDVTGALPKYLHKMGVEVKVFLPKYALIDHSKYNLDYSYPIGEMPVRVAGKVHTVRVFHSYLPGSQVEVYFIDCPHYYHRKHIYTNDPDEDERFILFNKAVIEALQRLNWKPDLINCADWQTGLIPLYIKDNYSWDRFFEQTATVMTIHNIGYQGRFPKDTIHKAEIKPDLFYENSAIEIWGSVSFLKAGLMYADAINTVSETYAEEITDSSYGEGLEGVLRYRINDFVGILNGVDYTVWDPLNDKFIPHRFSADNLEEKVKNKKYLLESVKLKYDPEVPLAGIVSRLVAQKGFDLVVKSIYDLMNLNMQWVILGSGADEYENLFRSLSYAYPEKVFTYIGFHDELSHLIEAGSDMFLMPSRYEPCGLNQIYSLKYGTVPIVHKTGGLADTVHDWHEYFARGDMSGTGFSFEHYLPSALLNTVQRAYEVYHDRDTWMRIMLNGMAKDFSWEISAKKYLDLYHKAIYNRRFR